MEKEVITFEHDGRKEAAVLLDERESNGWVNREWRLGNRTYWLGWHQDEQRFANNDCYRTLAKRFPHAVALFIP